MSQKILDQLVNINRQVASHNTDNERRIAKLIIANRTLVIQNKEKEKQLVIETKKHQKTKAYLKQCEEGLKKIMFMISHKVRQPIVNIIGLSNLLGQTINLPGKLKKVTEYIKQSVLALDVFTKELVAFISKLGKNKQK